LSRDSREEVRRRFRFQCGYCGVSETDAGSQLTLDHFQPRSRGGTDELDNLVYCCHACNEFKGDFWASAPDLPLLHPLRDEIPQHISSEPDGSLRGITEIGRRHIERLHLNRPALTALRRERMLLAQAKAEQAELVGRVRSLEHEIQALTDQIQARARPEAEG